MCVVKRMHYSLEEEKNPRKFSKIVPVKMKYRNTFRSFDLITDIRRRFIFYIYPLGILQNTRC